MDGTPTILTQRYLSQEDILSFVEEFANFIPPNVLENVVFMSSPDGSGTCVTAVRAENVGSFDSTFWNAWNCQNSSHFIGEETMSPPLLPMPIPPADEEQPDPTIDEFTSMSPLSITEPNVEAVAVAASLSKRKSALKRNRKQFEREEQGSESSNKRRVTFSDVLDVAPSMCEEDSLDHIPNSDSNGHGDPHAIDSNAAAVDTPEAQSELEIDPSSIDPNNILSEIHVPIVERKLFPLDEMEVDPCDADEPHHRQQPYRPFEPATIVLDKPLRTSIVTACEDLVSSGYGCNPEDFYFTGSQCSQGSQGPQPRHELTTTLLSTSHAPISSSLSATSIATATTMTERDSTQDPLKLHEWPSFLWPRCKSHLPPLSTIRTVRGGVILVLINSSPRLQDNLALTGALWLSQRLNLPVAVMALIDRDIVSDMHELRLRSPSQHQSQRMMTPARPPLSGDRRVNFVTPSSINSSADGRFKSPGSTPQNSVAKKSLERKSIHRCQTLLQLKEELEAFHIPLLLFSFTATSSTSSFTTTPSSAAGGSRASQHHHHHQQQQQQQWCPKALALKALLKNASSSSSSSSSLDNSYISAVFADDHQHPANNQLCSLIAEQTNLPLFSFDSSSILSAALQQRCSPNVSPSSFSSSSSSSSLSSLLQPAGEHREQRDVIISQKQFEEIVMEESRLETPPWHRAVDTQKQRLIQREMSCWNAPYQSLPKIFPVNELLHTHNQEAPGTVRLVSWEDMRAALVQAPSSSLLSLSSVSSLNKQSLVSPLVLPTASLEGMDEESLVIAHQAGLLSPRAIHQLIKQCGEGFEFSTALQRIVWVEYAVQSLKCTQTVHMAFNPTAATWAIPWFDALPLSLLQFLFEDKSPLLQVRIGMRNKLEKVSPIMVRGGKTQSERFNELQRLFMENGTFPMAKDLQYWILYYLLHLPTVEMGLHTVFKEMATHCRVYLEESIYPAAIFLQALQDIYEQFSSLQNNMETMAMQLKERFGRGLVLQNGQLCL